MHSRLLWLAGGFAVLLTACATASHEDRVRAETHRQLGEIKLARHEVELAIREYRNALKLYQKDPETHFGVSEAYRRKGVFDLAEHHLQQTLRLDPANVDARLNLGVVYLQMERWQDAIRVNSTLIKDPTFYRPGRALVNRGWAHYKSGNAELAQRDYSEALKQGGARVYAHMNLGILYYSRGETVDAVNEFERVVELLQGRQPEMFGASEAEARFRLAQAHVKLGHHEKAIEHLKLAEERGGKGQWGRKSGEYLAVLR
ncbi:MAG: tetratricopeptide repeat protein [Deltaproteobacteria bacterium]|nr:tetratricopeptide repeat protein [Deltaproteobacteria bacterium]